MDEDLETLKEEYRRLLKRYESIKPLHQKRLVGAINTIEYAFGSVERNINQLSDKCLLDRIRERCIENILEYLSLAEKNIVYGEKKLKV
ncbi:MAG: hypothetical protein PHD81_03800 [Candidatus Nanoarchaeia archaeon]|nr:hypothetical protein [Candidatus Nanoarchaeia archaeon]MDD5588206.1 hypothetical protein [Candidatus Nanoarchaeia archaeon]